MEAAGETDRVETGAQGGSGSPAGDLINRLRGLSRRRILILAGGALFVAAAAAAGTVVSREAAPVVEIEFGGALVYEAFPDVVADLKSEGGQPRYVKLGIVIELPEDLRPRLATRHAAIVDALNAYLRERRVEELTGEAGAIRVREALTAIINDQIAPSQVKAVLFREFIVS